MSLLHINLYRNILSITYLTILMECGLLNQIEIIELNTIVTNNKKGNYDLSD